MKKLFTMNFYLALAIFITLDTFCTGLGMGVPIFCILLGMPTGWYFAHRFQDDITNPAGMLKKLISSAALTSSYTMLIMTLIWSRMVPMLFNPNADLANFGIPLILYEPRASFISWIVLMMLISPFLQFLMALLGSCLGWQWLLKKK